MVNGIVFAEDFLLLAYTYVLKKYILNVNRRRG